MFIFNFFLYNCKFHPQLAGCGGNFLSEVSKLILIESYGPVQVSHPLNTFLRQTQGCDNYSYSSELARKLLSSSQNYHVCHRKAHVITHTLYYGVVWRVFVPFTLLLSVKWRAALWVKAWQDCL